MQVDIKHILCAVDFSDLSAHAIEQAVVIARWYKARITALHVYKPFFMPGLLAPTDRVPEAELQRVYDELPPAQALALAEYRRYSQQSTMAQLKSLVPDSIPASRKITTRVRHGKPYVETLRVAAEDQDDLIVIGVHGRNPLDLNLFGSTANQVVRRATCPVLTLRGDDTKH